MKFHCLCCHLFSTTHQSHHSDRGRRIKAPSENIRKSHNTPRWQQGTAPPWVATVGQTKLPSPNLHHTGLRTSETYNPTSLIQGVKIALAAVVAVNKSASMNTTESHIGHYPMNLA